MIYLTQGVVLKVNCCSNFKFETVEAEKTKELFKLHYLQIETMRRCVFKSKSEIGFFGEFFQRYLEIFDIAISD